MMKLDMLNPTRYLPIKEKTTKNIFSLLLLLCFSAVNAETIELISTHEPPEAFDLSGFENVTSEIYVPQSGVYFEGDGCNVLSESFSASIENRLSEDFISDIDRTMDLFIEHVNFLSMQIVSKSIQCKKDEVVQEIYGSTESYFSGVLKNSYAFQSLGVIDKSDWREFIDYFISPVVSKI